MANSTISGLTNAAALTGTERVAVVQSGATVDCSAQDLADLSGGIAQGTSFPGSPSSGDFFRRTDRGGIAYRYDGTRWLTAELFRAPMEINHTTLPINLASGALALGRFAHPSSDYDVYVEQVRTTGRYTGSGGQNDIAVTFYNAAGSTEQSATIENDVSGTTDPHNKTATINGVWSKNSIGYWQITRNTGTIFGYPCGGFTYRLVG